MTDLLQAQNILVCLRWGIGDMVMEMPALDALRNRLPKAGITGIGAFPATELMEGDVRLDACRTYQEFGIGHWGDEGSAAKREGFGNWLRRMRFDAVLDPSHAPLAIGRAVWENKGRIFDAGQAWPDPVLQGGGSCIESVNFAVRRGWGIPVPGNPNPKIRLAHEWERRANDFFEKHFPDGDMVVALSPVASSFLKTWPIDNYRRLCHYLGENGVNRLVFCGPSGPHPNDFLIENAGNGKIAFVKDVHLLYTASLLGGCRLLVCNDTGLMHVSAAVGTPVVGIFGPTDPRVYLPRDPPSSAVAPPETECRFRRTCTIGPAPCVLHQRCLAGHKPCIAGIPLEDVIAAVETFTGAVLPPPERHIP
ncbi:MAG: glycosyltransferase family 9 protein [Desulfobacterales bacterium]